MDRYIIRKRKLLEDENDCGTSGQQSGAICGEAFNSSGLTDISSKVSAEIKPSPPNSEKTECIKIISHDIGTYLENISTISDLTKYELLKNPWKAGKDYNYPASIHQKRGREERRKVQNSHFLRYPWLVFSPAKQGLLCKTCVIFCSHEVGRYKTVIPKFLVTEPLQKYSKLTGKDGHLETHNTNEYHQKAAEQAKLFIKTFEAPFLDVRNQISSSRQQQVFQNRERLVPIIKTLILHGRQNIPLRGHRDDGSVLDSDGDPTRNEGNFRALLRFRVESGDTVLKKHLETSGANATYISKTTCNELINCIGEDILNYILKEVSESKYYSVLFDETTDVSHKSQLSLSVRYVSCGTIKENFVGFIDLQEGSNENGETEKAITGRVLGQSVLKLMKELQLDLKMCVGIGCDGCAVNMSEICGAVKEIQKDAVNASLCPCKNHQLNLSISRCCDVPAIRNTLGTIQEMVGFFNASSKRHAVLEKYLGHSLVGPCKTRWVERHESILQIKRDLLSIAETLEEISTWHDKDTAVKANLLLKGISNNTFILALCSLGDLMAITKPLSQVLQTKTLDAHSARRKIDDTLNVLKDRRTHAEKYFSQIVSEASSTMEFLGIKICIPRLAKVGGWQKYRMNVSMEGDSSPSDYWRRVVYVPTLDYIIMDMETRFSKESLTYLHLNCLMPTNLKGIATTDVKQHISDVIETLNKVVSNTGSCVLEELTAEVQLMINSQDFKNLEDSPLALCETLDSDFYPNLHVLYRIIATLPVSIATSERSFSTLRRLKTWLRSRMTEDRLTGLALMHVHQNIPVDINTVIDRFARKKRKKEFVL